MTAENNPTENKNQKENKKDKEPYHNLSVNEELVIKPEEDKLLSEALELHLKQNVLADEEDFAEDDGAGRSERRAKYAEVEEIEEGAVLEEGDGIIESLKKDSKLNFEENEQARDFEKEEITEVGWRQGAEIKTSTREQQGEKVESKSRSVLERTEEAKEEAFDEPLNLKERVRLLGVGIDPVTLTELRNILEYYLHDGHQHFLATINAEFIMEARQNKHFKNILSYSDLNVDDGVSILWATHYLNRRIDDAWIHTRKRRVTYRKLMVFWQAFYTLAAILFHPSMLRDKIPTRITGVMVINELVKLSLSGNFSVYLLGGEPGVVASAKMALEKEYPQSLIVGCRSGFLGKGEEEKHLVEAVNKAKADILIVGLGSPKQEEFIFKNMDRMPSVKIAVGVGGALDFIAQHKRRAPLWMRKRGLEWLFRFYLEPKRKTRIKRATWDFVKEVVGWKLKNN